jgi:hypothetical protein
MLVSVDLRHTSLDKASARASVVLERSQQLERLAGFLSDSTKIVFLRIKHF